MSDFGKSITTIADLNPSVSITGLPDNFLVSFIGMADVSEDGFLINKHERPLREVKSGFTRFIEGDVLFAKITPCMENGKGAIAKGLKNKIGFGSTEFHVFRNKQNGDAEFIYQILQSPGLRLKAEARMTGSAGQKRVPSEFFNLYKTFIPASLSEQRKIARILSTADAVIEKTQTAIAKYKAIKQGMLHDLFTRGIDPATNKLRPTYEDAPHLYKQSKLGWIPKEWEVETFSEVVEIINGGTPSTHIKEYWNGEIPWLSVEDFNKEKRYVYDAIKKISEFGLKNSATNLLKKDMIIISARGTVGVIAQIGNDMAFNQSCYGINSLKKELTNDFIYYFLIYYKSKFGFSSFGSVFNTITRDYFDSMEIAMPSDSDCDEMIEITNKLSLIDYKLQTEQAYLHKLQQIKTGLMADLLSGKKEVRVDEEPVS